MATDRLGSVAYKFGTGLAVQNFGFESYQLAPWAPYGEAQVSISNVSRTGGHSMRLTTTVSDYDAYQDVKGLVAGMSYQFQTWVRAESGTNLAVLAVCEPAGGGFVWTGPQTITTDWRLLTVYFTATSNGTARIILAKYDTTGALLWDDVEMPGGATAISGVKMRYYPYGQEVGAPTANDTAKFGTYTRDSVSGEGVSLNRRVGDSDEGCRQLCHFGDFWQFWGTKGVGCQGINGVSCLVRRITSHSGARTARKSSLPMRTDRRI